MTLRTHFGARLLHTLTRFALLAGLAIGSGAHAGIPPGLSDTVGIRITPNDVNPRDLEVDFDLTLYDRDGSSSWTTAFAGVPTAGVPAVDFGDGNTVSTVPLGLVGAPGDGPGGSTVYQTLSSITHTYPAPGIYTARAGGICWACARGQYTFFPIGSPQNPNFTGSFDYLPNNVIGNLAARLVYSATTLSPFSSSSIAYRTTYYAAVTNTANFFIGSNVPTLAPWALLLAGALLAGGGAAYLGRKGVARRT